MFSLSYQDKNLGLGFRIFVTPQIPSGRKNENATLFFRCFFLYFKIIDIIDGRLKNCYLHKNRHQVRVNFFFILE